MRWKLVPTGVAALAVILFAFAAAAQQQKPNILVIMADDIGYWNVSAYNRGQMGYRRAAQLAKASHMVRLSHEYGF